MQRHGKYFIHKEHRDYNNVEQRRDGCFCQGEGFKCEQGGRAQVHKCTVEEGCIEGIWIREYKGKITESARGVQKTLMQTEQSSVTEWRQGW
jgi:hypothetical protein